MKKTIISYVLATILILGTSGTVFAHGHSSTTAHSKQSVCNIESCTLTKAHKHNKTTYSAHYDGDGHNYHEGYNHK